MSYTVPSLEGAAAKELADLLQDRLNALTDLHLTLKHVHWNVVGPHFIAVHEMLDPQVAVVRKMADTTAERIATLGYEAIGVPGALVRGRDWDDYSVNRAGAIEHLAALNLVYDGVITGHRAAIDRSGDLDPVTEDMLIGQSAQLEQFQWFVRAHLERDSGDLVTAGTRTEKAAAAAVPAGDEPAQKTATTTAKKAAKKATKRGGKAAQ